jgi:hypothetical protein
VKNNEYREHVRRISILAVYFQPSKENGGNHSLLTFQMHTQDYTNMTYIATVSKEQLYIYRKTIGRLIFMHKCIMLRQVPTIYFRHVTFFQYICSLVGTGGQNVKMTSHIHLVLEFKMPTEQL